MKFDAFFVCEDPHNDPARAYSEVLGQIVKAEQLGFHGAWLAEHHGSTYGAAPEPAILLTAAAERTSRILLGSGVSILPFTHPVHLASQYAMLDVLSGGRLRFGTGRGYQPREFELFGIDPEHSRELYAESIEIIRGLWENESFSFEGKHFTLPEMRLNPRPLQEKVPMWVAAASPESFEAAADLGVQVFTQPSLRQTLNEMRVNMNTAIDAYVDRGYPRETVDIPVNVIFHLADTAEQAKLQAEGPLSWHFEKLRTLAPGAGGSKIAKGYEAYKSYGPLKNSATAGAAGDTRVSIESLNNSGIAVIGSADDARKALRRMQEDFQLDHISCFVRFGGIDDDAVKESMRILAEEVMPEFTSVEALSATR